MVEIHPVSSIHTRERINLSDEIWTSQDLLKKKGGKKAVEKWICFASKTGFHKYMQAPYNHKKLWN